MLNSCLVDVFYHVYGAGYVRVKMALETKGWGMLFHLPIPVLFSVFHKEMAVTYTKYNAVNVCVNEMAPFGPLHLLSRAK